MTEEKNIFPIPCRKKIWYERSFLCTQGKMFSPVSKMGREFVYLSCLHHHYKKRSWNLLRKIIYLIFKATGDGLENKGINSTQSCLEGWRRGNLLSTSMRNDSKINVSGEKFKLFKIWISILMVFLHFKAFQSYWLSLYFQDSLFHMFNPLGRWVISQITRKGLN